jgi:aminopeptidase N
MVNRHFWSLTLLAALAATALAHPKSETPVVSHWGATTSTRQVGFDVLHYDLGLTVDVAGQELRGTTSVAFLATEDGLQEMLFHLAVLEVDSIVYGGESVPYDHQGEEVWVTLPAPLPAGSVDTLHITYHGHPTNEGWGGFFFTPRVTYSVGVGLNAIPPSMARYWYPCYDEPSDKALFDLRVTVPSANIVASGGSLVSVDPDSTGAWCTYHWREDHPCSPYLACVHVSPYAVITDSVGGLPYRYYVYPDDSAAARVAFAKVPQMVAAYQARFGPYPFDKVAYAETPLSGGMEHQGCITLGSFAVTGGQAWESLIAHELSHMWWGDRVTVADWREVWLSEGFATYCEAFWDETEEGWGAYRQTVASFMQAYLASRIMDPMYDPPPEYLWSELTYEKGACVLHMLRGVLGDSLFFQVLGTYGQEHAYGNVTTDSLRVAVEDCYGQDMEWFFDEWVYEGGHPVLDIAWGTWPAAGDSYAIEAVVRQVQSVPTTFVMPIHVQAAGAQDTASTTLWISSGEDWVRLALSEPPLGLSVDPDVWVLKEIHSAVQYPRIVARGLVARDSIGGDGDGCAEEGETAEIVVHLANNFRATEPLELVLETEDPSLSILDATAALDSIPHQGEATNADDPFVVSIASPLEDHVAELDVIVSSALGYRDTLPVELFVGTPAVFLVDDDGAATYETYYTEALDSLGALTQWWEVSLAGSPAPSRLLELAGSGRAVVWYTGDEDSCTLTEQDQAAVRSFVESGGSLFLSGQDIGHDLVLDGHGAEFYEEVLHAGLIADTYTGTKGIRGVPGDPIGDGLMSLIQGSGGADNQDSPDVITALGAAESVFTYYTGEQCAALRHEGPGRLVYLAFGFEAVNKTGPQTNDRAEVMTRILSWLGVTEAGDEAPLTLLDHPAVLARPNPARDGALLQWSGCSAEVRIVDLTGRLVRRLWDPRGSTEWGMVRWDGLDARGVAVPPGVYFVSAGGVSSPTRLIVVR